MAQQHLDPTDPTAGPVPADALARYLRDRATEFLRALRLHRETGAGAAASEESVEAARALRRAARRISASLHTFQPVLDRDWSEALRPELAWVSGTLAQEHACAARLDQLLLALHRLSGAPPFPTQTAAPARDAATTPARPPSGDGPTRSPGPATAPPGTRGADSRGETFPATPQVTGTTAAPATAATSTPRPTASGTAGPTGPTGPTGAPGDAPRTPAGAPGTAPARPARTVPATDGVTGAARRTAKATATATVTTAAEPPRTGALTPDAARAARPVPAPDRGNLTVGAAKAGALLDRQLTLARTRAHSTALQALGSSRFHGVADKVALLASEVPLTPAADGVDLRPYADAARERLTDAVAALPLLTAGSPYNAAALIHGLSPDPSPHPQDAPWHQVRLLLRLYRYAREVLDTGAGTGTDLHLLAAGEALDRHHDASEAAAAAAQAARTPRIAPATAYALGVLHADQRHEVEAARYAFQRAWQKQALGTP